VVLEADAPCCHGALQEEPQGNLGLLGLDECANRLVAELEDLLALLLPVLILQGVWFLQMYFRWIARQVIPTYIN